MDTPHLSTTRSTPPSLIGRESAATRAEFRLHVLTVFCEYAPAMRRRDALYFRHKPPRISYAASRSGLRLEIASCG